MIYEKVSLLGLALVGAASASAGAGVSIPYLGVPLNVVGAAIAGAFCSFAFGEAVKPRAQLFKLALACTLLGASFISVLELFGFTVQPSKQAPLALICAAVMRWIVPAFQKNVSTLMRRLVPSNDSYSVGEPVDGEEQGSKEDGRFD